MKAKADWEMRGEWDSELDRKDWIDDATGYVCAMRRNHGGAWCGYVGIPTAHPWYGKSYIHQVKVPDSIIQRQVDVDKIGAINILCASLSEKSDAMKENFLDIVLAIDVHGGLTYAGHTWPQKENDGLWYFGFDCSHAGDFSPGYERNWSDGYYRDEEYVTGEVTNLAKQLKAVAV